MSLIRRMRKQKAVWWKRQTADEYGAYRFAEPVQIDCRWEDVTQQFIDVKGEPQVSRSLVYVDRVLVPGDMLKRGDLEGGMTSDPNGEDGAFEIRRFDQLPNLRNSEVLYTAYL